MASGRLADYIGVGPIASRPAAPDLYAGTLGLWFAPDIGVLSAWDEASWEDIGSVDSIVAAQPSGGWSDGSLLIYSTALGAFVEIPPGVPGQVLTQQSGQVADWEDQVVVGGAVDSVNGQTGVVVLSLFDLSDVLPNTGTPEDGDVLAWSATQNAWIALPPSDAVSSVNGQTGAVTLSLEDLDDVMTGTGAPDIGDTLVWDGSQWVAQPQSGVVSRVGMAFEKEIALSDLTAALTAGTTKGYWRPAFAATGVSARLSLRVSSSSGLPTVDMNKSGVSMMSTKLSIDVGETTSLTAATPVVMSDTTWAIDDLIEFDIDIAGTGAMGAIVTVTGLYA